MIGKWSALASWLVTLCLAWPGAAVAAGPEPEDDNVRHAGSEAGEEREFEISDGVKMVFCWVPAGSFQMGSPEGAVGRYEDEGPVREVRISRGFWLAKYPVTQREWEAVMGSNPSTFNRERVGADTSRHPVENVSWQDIGGDEDRQGGFLGRVNRHAPEGWHYDLPTEAQWEYACRAGTTSALNSGKELTSEHGRCRNLDEVAWYDGNSGTQPVGQKEANAWGLHDMHGNVWEWCRDWYQNNYGGLPTVDPEGPANGARRVIRGGSWSNHAVSCRAACRYRLTPGFRIRYLGFRPALVPSGQGER